MDMLTIPSREKFVKNFCVLGFLALGHSAVMTAGTESETQSRDRFTGYPAHIVENSLSRRLQKRLIKDGFDFVPKTAHCSAYLPLFSNHAPLLGGLLQMRHTWIEINERSYGMAYTLDHHYFGGEARIQSPDGFQKYKLWDVQCNPLLAPKSQRARFKKNLRALLTRVAHPENFLVLNYHVFQHNCLAAVDWAVECAGGKLSRVPNLGIGRFFSADFKAFYRNESPSTAQSLDEICKKAKREAFHF